MRKICIIAVLFMVLGVLALPASLMGRAEAVDLAQVEELYNWQQKVYGSQEVKSFLTWEEIVEPAGMVDYSRVPKLSELLGHVFLLTDSYGFRSHGDASHGVNSMLHQGSQQSALVYFVTLPDNSRNRRSMIALLDKSGTFVSDYKVRPLIVRFNTRSQGANGLILGSSNVGEGTVQITDSLVDLSLEKTGQAGVYHLVYYVTTVDRNGEHLTRSDCYATLQLIK